MPEPVALSLEDRQLLMTLTEQVAAVADALTLLVLPERSDNPRHQNAFLVARSRLVARSNERNAGYDPLSGEEVQ